MSVREGQGPNPENESKTIGIRLPRPSVIEISLKKHRMGNFEIIVEGRTSSKVGGPPPLPPPPIPTPLVMVKNVVFFNSLNFPDAGRDLRPLNIELREIVIL